MISRIRSRRRAAVALTLVLMLSGCNSGPFVELAQYNPLLRDDRSHEALYGPLPVERMKQLTELASTADELTPQQRQQWAVQLSQQLPSEPDSLIRQRMVEALGALNAPEAMQGLQAALQDIEPDVRRTACVRLAGRSDPQTAQILATVLGNDTDAQVRIAAARALGRFEQREAVQALGLALDDPDPAARHCAMQSLHEATGRDYGDNVEAWRQYVRGDTPNAEARPSLAERWRDTPLW